MSWNCDVATGLQAKQTVDANLCSEGVDPITGEMLTDPIVLECGPNGQSKTINCYNKSTLARMKREGQLERDPYKREFTSDAKRKLDSMFGSSTSSSSPVFNITSPYAFQSTPSFFSPSRRFDVNLARRSLFDELRSYQPRNYVADNIDIFSAVKGDLLDNVYSYVHKPRINLNPRDRAGNTPLITALLDNNNKASALLIIKGANVNTSNNAGLTPLMAAASNNNELMVDILLKKGANRSARTINGMTASDFTTDPDIKLLIQETKRRKSSKRRSKSRSRSKKKPCRADQVRDRSTGRCRKRKR